MRKVRIRAKIALRSCDRIVVLASAERHLEGRRGHLMELEAEEVAMGAESLECPGKVRDDRNAEGSARGDDAEKDAGAVRSFRAPREEHVPAQLATL